ncbi:FUSC family protein [Alloacidobacterium dinghuense]|uniref:FUSC family protein n=1 Tax=Alloacidobacterium dinghuense TaxID=2763107 RepID=A0A7G8BNX2_9BACT|nr:FUSC family protein [Alloacidobacterium dinghuense]QNI34242.1 FUSC family protein [Alloacidobacterium dinghuense]
MATGQIERGASQRGLLFRTSHAVGSATILAIACLLSYWLITTVLTREYSVSRNDDLLGGMWAVVATIFVYRSSYQKMARAVVSRTVATLVSFVACLAYLLFFPFHVVGMAALIGIIAIILALVRRSEDIVMAAITIAVVLVIADISPRNAWIQPILRLVDTAVGISVGIAASWISLGLGLSSKLEHSGA